jgi:exodeoxyribonuclease-3
VKIATFNVNSIRKRLDIVLDWLARAEPDVLCLQETKVADDQFPALAFQQAGYRIVFSGQKGYNGVAIASREPLSEVRTGLDDGGPRDDARLIRARLGRVRIVNTYVPQGMDVTSDKYAYKLDWFARLAAFFDREYTPRQQVVWVGDLNVAPTDIDVHDPKRLLGHVCFNPEVQAAFGAVVGWGFEDVFRKHLPDAGVYTFYDYRGRHVLEANKGWRIDHILATKPLAKKSLGVTVDLEPRRAETPSDHAPVMVAFAV